MKDFLKNILPFNNREDMSVWQFVIKKFLAFWLCFIVASFVAEGVIILVHLACGKNLLAGEFFDEQILMLMQFYGEIIFIGVVLLYWKLIERKSFVQMGITKRIGSYLYGVILAVLLLFISVGFIIICGGFEYLGIFENINVVMILLFIGSFIVQGAMEEFLCRGLVFHALKDKTNNWVAIGVSTLVFILPHWSALFAGEVIYGLLGIVNLILISLIFCLLTLRFGSIWAACGLHSIWNAILYTILGLNLSGNEGSIAAVFNIKSVGNNILNGGMYGLEASILTVVIQLIVAIWLGLDVKKKNQH